MTYATQQSEDSLSIEEKLRQAWKQEQRFFHIRGLSRLLIWAIALLLIDLLVDWQIFFRSRLSGPTILLLIVNVGILAWIAWHEWLRFLKRYDPLRVSLEVESKHPELLSVLVSYTQLKDKSNVSNASPALLDAMRGQAVKLTRPLDFREVVDFRQLRNLMITTVVAIAFFSTVTWLWSGHMHSLLLRLVGIATPYPTQTQIAAVTGDLTIKEGDTVEIAALANGRIPQAGRLCVRFEDDNAWEPLVMSRGAQDAFTRTIPEIYENLSYYVRLGDAVSDRHTIFVSPPPQIVETKVHLKYPEYLANNSVGAPPVEELNLSVPEATIITWRLRCEPPIRALDVKIQEAKSGEKTILAEVSEDGNTAVFQHVADETFKYTFLWTEKEHGFTYGDVLHVVRVVPDMVPDVELLEPSRDGLATVNKTLQIHGKAIDDHGLASAVLVYSVNGSDERRSKIHSLYGTSKEIAYRWSLRESLPTLKPGDKLAFSLEVCDAYPGPRPHVNISATRRLSIVSEPDYLEWFKSEMNAQREQISQILDAEQKAETEVKKLTVEEKKGN